MACIEHQKVLFGTHMLSEEANDLWDIACQRMKDEDIEVTWTVFRAEFLKKYFPEDVRSKKVIQFLGMKQGNSIVAEYVAKFEELVKFCPYYNTAASEGSKCIKFESGLRPEIKQNIRYQEICRFSVLEFGDRISECKSTKVNCFKCGKADHRAAECKTNTLTCYNYGEQGHISNQFQKPKKAQFEGKRFSLSGS
ncbi:uncharacterized protein LOC127136295 [Lathyrus oleraceus]|uniref:uncharacterized protein LOC127136295 n=1 Tax=Pisum sativum TaxID=3888 RepID=UPI0021D09A93|nr:uncharacterized protein LOC127136295 [Pisum sativum]